MNLLGTRKLVEKKMDELGMDEFVRLDNTRSAWNREQWKCAMLLSIFDTACNYRLTVLNNANPNRQKQVKILKVLFWIFHFAIPFVIFAYSVFAIFHWLFFD